MISLIANKVTNAAAEDVEEEEGAEEVEEDYILILLLCLFLYLNLNRGKTLNYKALAKTLPTYWQNCPPTNKKTNKQNTEHITKQKPETNNDKAMHFPVCRKFDQILKIARALIFLFLLLRKLEIQCEEGP